MFQSTGSRGARRGAADERRDDRRVSIHGLAWSPTQRGGTGPGAGHCFNPRARVEPDINSFPVVVANTEFQSTGSRGARPETVTEKRANTCFNPRARVEPDPMDEEKKLASKVSIHGLAWSPTYLYANQLSFYQVSIHGLAWSPTL